jgi:hypothetical protein
MIETLEELADYKYDIYDRIATYRPKVISAFGIPDMKHPVIAENYIVGTNLFKVPCKAL